MAIAIGDKIKVIIETPDGTILEAPAMAVSITTDPIGPFWSDFEPIYLKGRTHIELDLIGDMSWKPRRDWERSVETRRNSSEWKCDYCGRPNIRNAETCNSCGAVRSFIYDA